MAECSRFKEHYLTLDSRDRSSNVWPSISQFQIPLGSNMSYDDAPEDSAYQSVRRVEVIDAIYPNRNHVVREMYLYLCIPEIGGDFDASQPTGATALGKLIPTRLIGDQVHATFEPEMRPTKRFDFDGLDLTALTVEFRTRAGTLFDFGNEPDAYTCLTLRLMTQW